MRKNKNKGIKIEKYEYDFRTAFDILSSYEVLHNRQSYELVVKLGTDPQKSEQNVRGICVLPEGTGKTKKIAFFSKNQNIIDVAKREGFEIITDQALTSFSKQDFDFDVLYSSQADLAFLKPYARYLGPKGLFPNKKSGTLVEESTVEKEIADAKAGKIELRNNEKAELKCVLGRTNLTFKQVENNFVKILQFLDNNVPSKFKKEKFIKNMIVSVTYGPGLYLHLPYVLLDSP